MHCIPWERCCWCKRWAYRSFPQLHLPQ